MKTSTIIGEILAAWEDAANNAALDCHRNAEEDNYRLLRHGVDLPSSATQDEYIKAVTQAHKTIENGRELAKAWRIISNGLRRYLRVLHVETYSQRRANAENAPAKPWEKRKATEAMVETVGAYEPAKYARVPISLSSVEAIVDAAKANGIEVIE